MSAAVQSFQGGIEIVREIGEGALGGRSAADEHIVVTWPGEGFKPQPRDLAQAALHPVPQHGIAELLRGGETDAWRRGIAAGAHLDHHAGHGSIIRPCGGNEILPSLQAFHVTGIRRSGRKALAALGAAAGENIAAANGRHARAEAMATLADELRGLVGALHVRNSVLGLVANVFKYMA
jgi:hypothetical protein